ncbi:hypothetical protein [Chelativorans sp. YIM 93263]|uniref:hypothetical protein n=1 Tax=Chelativorans sp. YIM 93263 TaxID=2906648 RepID=UPI0023787C35|nr:hypothetical protein [Chelativorans sp. YIM 93263]
MLQLVLSFILGFLVAGGIALAIMPILWRRAGAAMRRRIEASLPMSREELQAEIDAVNAEHAMTVRRLEMKVAASKKKAGEDFIEINRLREQLARFQDSSAEKDEALAGLEQERESLASTLAAREAEFAKASSRLAEVERRLADKHADLERLSESYEEASLTSSSRQVELLARETEVERLNDSLAQMQRERERAERAVQEAKVEVSQTEEQLRTERHQVEELKRQQDRAAADLRGRDENLERLQKEIVRLKEKVRERDKALKEGKVALADMKKQNKDLEVQVADLQLQLSGGSDTTAAPKRRKPRKSSANGTADAALREQIASLAAEVVSMTAALEGPDSPIEKNLAEVPKDNGEDVSAQQMPSLAERVKALRLKTTSAE